MSRGFDFDSFGMDDFQKSDSYDRDRKTGAGRTGGSFIRPKRQTTTPNQVLSQSCVTACHSNLSQPVTVAADNISSGPWDRCRSRGLGPYQPAV